MSDAVITGLIALGGLLTAALLSARITWSIAVRSAKLELYKHTYPAKFQAAKDVMESATKAFTAVSTIWFTHSKHSSETEDIQAVRVQISEVNQWTISNEWLLGPIVRAKALKFIAACNNALLFGDDVFLDKPDVHGVELRHQKAFLELAEEIRRQVHFAQLESLFSPELADDKPNQGRSKRLGT